MPTGQRYSGYTSVFGYAPGATMVLRQNRNWSLNTNNQLTPQYPAGLVDPAAILLPAAAPQMQGETPDLLTLLGTVLLMSGKCFDEASTIYMQERADCDTFLAGAAANAHTYRRTTKGFMCIESISATQGDEGGAQGNYMYTPLHDGTNAIVQTAAAVDISGIAAPTYVSTYFLASPYENGAEIAGVQMCSFRPGIVFAAAPATPGAFPTIGSITRRGSRFQFRCAKGNQFDAVPTTGRALAGTFAMYLQKADPTNAAGNGRVAKATGAHIKISCAAGVLEVQSCSFNGTEDAGWEVTVHATGTPSISLTSAIP